MADTPSPHPSLLVDFLIVFAICLAFLHRLAHIPYFVSFKVPPLLPQPGRESEGLHVNLTMLGCCEHLHVRHEEIKVPSS